MCGRVLLRPDIQEIPAETLRISEKDRRMIAQRPRKTITTKAKDS